MFYISEIYNHAEVSVVEATYSDISLTIVRDTDSNFYRGFTCAYDLEEQSARIAGVVKRKSLNTDVYTATTDKMDNPVIVSYEYKSLSIQMLLYLKKMHFTMNYLILI